MEFLISFCVNWIIFILVIVSGYAARLISFSVFKSKRLQILAVTVVATIIYALIFKVSVVIVLTSYLLARGLHSSIIALIEKYIFKK